MPAAGRIWRSKEARGVRDALLCCAERGVLSDFTAGKLRLGRMLFTVSCNAGRGYRLLLDVAARTLQLSGLLPAVGERSALLKELKNFLRPLLTTQVAPLLRVDPGKGEVQLTAGKAGVTLVVRVKNSEYEYCTRRAVALADEIGRVFLRDCSYLVERRGSTGTREFTGAPV